MEIILGVLTVLSFFIAAYQTWKSKKSERQLIEANASIKSLEEGVLLSNFKLKKAMEYYESGDYKNSIELFKKYSNESDDVLDLHEAVKKYFGWRREKYTLGILVKYVVQIFLLW